MMENRLAHDIPRGRRLHYPPQEEPQSVMLSPHSESFNVSTACAVVNSLCSKLSALKIATSDCSPWPTLSP